MGFNLPLDSCGVVQTPEEEAQKSISAQDADGGSDGDADCAPGSRYLVHGQINLLEQARESAIKGLQRF